ncbi:solute carrier family 22 member 11 isoform 2-T2 [Trichechus inunguis]
MAFAELLERTGGMGLFQALQILTFFLPSVLLPPQLLLENFSAANPGHRCWTPMLDNSSEVPANLSLEALLTISIPTDPQHGPSQCHRFRHPQWQLLEPNATATNWSKATTEPCMDGWVYDHSTFTSTIITKWDLVCHSQHLKPMSQSIYMTGILLGSTTWGLLSDRCSWKLQEGGAGCTGLHRHHSFGDPSEGGRDQHQHYLCPEFPHLLWPPVHERVCTGRHHHDLLNAQWLPESARWLIIMGKPDKGLQELKKVARINGNKEAKKTLTIEVLMSSMQEELASTKTRQSWLDLFHMPKLRWRLLGLLVVIFSVTFSYYGLVLDLQNLGSDIFLLQVLFGAIDFLGRATTPFLLKFFGRRFTIASSQSTAGFFILANVLVPQDFQTLRVVFAVLGKGCFGVTLTCLAVYRTELFPTSLRMTADGLLQSAGRLGAVMGPLIRMTRQALPLLPPLSYGIIPIASSLLLLLLPETQGLPLPDTVQNLESQKRSAPAGGDQREVVNTESTWF